MLSVWKGAVFEGVEVFRNSFALSVEFSSCHDNSCWILTNIYGPCDAEGKRSFLDWFGNVRMPNDVCWLVVGDFNLLRKPEDRNRPGGNISEMLLFNNAISSLGLTKIPLNGRNFTWTNKQHPPLLERLDWFFTSGAWAIACPYTAAKALVMKTSDHWPYVIEIKTNIPKSKIFRFENFWMEHESFLPLVAACWNGPFPPKLILHSFCLLNLKL